MEEKKLGKMTKGNYFYFCFHWGESLPKPKSILIHTVRKKMESKKLSPFAKQVKEPKSFFFSFHGSPIILQLNLNNTLSYFDYNLKSLWRGSSSKLFFFLLVVSIRQGGSAAGGGSGKMRKEKSESVRKLISMRKRLTGATFIGDFDILPTPWTRIPTKSSWRRLEFTARLLLAKSHHGL